MIHSVITVPPALRGVVERWASSQTGAIENQKIKISNNTKKNYEYQKFEIGIRACSEARNDAVVSMKRKIDME